MKVCIVGHGKSLEGKSLGHDIDDCDQVMRLKKGWKLCASHPEDYGSRTDLLVASTETMGTFPTVKPELVNGAMYFAYPKFGWYPEIVIHNAEQMLGRKITIPLNLLNYWNFRFRHMGATHPNFSLGMAGVIIAAAALHPETIVLAGMDSILDPSQPFTRIHTVSRTGSGEFPNHDWPKEHQLLDLIAQTYEFNYESIHGERGRGL